MNKEDYEVAIKYYLSRFQAAKTQEDRNAWALLVAQELPKLIDSLADIEPMLALHSGEAK